MATYRVAGNRKDKYFVLEDGGVLYDLLESRDEARAIRDVLRDGIGPEWDAVDAELQRRFPKATLDYWKSLY